MSEEKLKSCPFCGGEARTIPYSFEDFAVRCKECGCGTGIYDTEEEAIEAWNRRVPQRTWTQKVYDSFGKVRDKE